MSNPRKSVAMENNVCMCQSMVDKVKAVCAEFNNDPGELINILHRTQEMLGYLPSEAAFYQGIKVGEMLAYSAKLRGVESCRMILAGGEGDHIEVVFLPDSMPVGTKMH